jgi:hypothetical protein
MAAVGEKQMAVDIRYEFGNAGAGARRPLSRLRLAQMPDSAARLGRFNPTVAPSVGTGLRRRAFAIQRSPPAPPGLTTSGSPRWLAS